MINEFRKFLENEGVLKEYCECTLELGSSINLSSIGWSGVISLMFGWSRADRMLPKRVSWGQISLRWTIKFTEPSAKIPYTSRDEFIHALLKPNKKIILMAKIKDFK